MGAAGEFRRLQLCACDSSAGVRPRVSAVRGGLLLLEQVDLGGVVDELSALLASALRAKLSEGLAPRRGVSDGNGNGPAEGSGDE